MDPLLYTLVLGATLAQLRERRGLRQNELADRLGLSKQRMSRIERGLSPVDMALLQQLTTALDVDRERLQVLVDRAIERTREAARQTLKVSGKAWWQPVQAQVGEVGLQALVSFGVASVMADQDRSAGRKESPC